MGSFSSLGDIITIEVLLEAPFDWRPPDSRWRTRYFSLLGKSEVSNENLGVSIENLGVFYENFGVSNENMGVSLENLRVSNENLGSPTRRSWGVSNKYSNGYNFFPESYF